MKTKYSILISMLLTLAFVFFSGCSNEENINSPISLELEKTGNINFSLNKTSTTENIDTVTAILTRSGYLAIEQDLAMTNNGAQSTINDIATGLWQLLVEAKNNEGAVLYRGKTNVEIKGNQITYVDINLASISATGDLSINVSWRIPEGINWTKYANNPIVIPGTTGSWESKYTNSPSVIFDGTLYKMWYTGFDGTNYRIGYATSSDGINWIKYTSNPVLDIGNTGAWDSKRVLSPTVIYDGIEYKMWYSGSADDGTYRIGYATSPDGISWTKHSGNPILTSGAAGSWDSYYVSGPTVLYDGNNYKMWFSGYDEQNIKIGYATSSDGINWNKYSGNPVMSNDPGNSWEAIHVDGPTVLFDGKNYKMWYSGFGTTSYKIGYASSADGINWTRSSENPVLDLGNSGTWDNTHVFYPTVLYDGIKLRMWYHGSSGTSYSIGYATDE
ncbi:MAG: hypothetical protein ACEPO8_09500 [Rhodothermaceae bacterium]